MGNWWELLVLPTRLWLWISISSRAAPPRGACFKDMMIKESMKKERKRERKREQEVEKAPSGIRTHNLMNTRSSSSSPRFPSVRTSLWLKLFFLRAYQLRHIDREYHFSLPVRTAEVINKMFIKSTFFYFRYRQSNNKNAAAIVISNQKVTFLFRHTLMSFLMSKIGFLYATLKH